MPRQKRVLTKTIHAENWDNHEIVVIRSLTGYDSDWIQDNMMSTVAGSGSMDVKLGTATRLTLIRCIESWTFTDANDQPIPWPPLSMREADNVVICKQRERSLEHVFPEDREWIYKEINAINQPLGDDEKKDSLIHGNNGSGANPGVHLIPLSIEK